VRYTEAQKKRIDTWTARFYRRASGRITKREAETLARRDAGDWTYLARSADKLALRTPIAELWGDGSTFFAREAKRDFATYGRGRPSAAYRGVDRHVDYLFAWTGFDREPGSRLLLVGPSSNGCGGGWRLSCAADCPCGKCWRPEVPVTLELVDRVRPIPDEGAAAYYERLLAAARPGLAKASPSSQDARRAS
jgi:hypothetical protein